MSFVVRADGDRLGVHHSEAPRIAKPIEDLGTVGDDLDVGRVQYWISLDAEVAPDARSLLEAQAPSALQAVELGETPDIADYETDDSAEPEQGEPGRKTRAGDPPASLERFLRYHKVDYDTFAPYQERFFEGLAELLVWHEVLGEDDELGPDNFIDAVKSFQSKKGETADGILGEGTLWALQYDWARARAFGVAKTPADKWAGDGYDFFRLREDGADAYNSLYEDVKRRGGCITSAGSLRSLKAQVTSGRSSTSIHYSGLAFDLATPSGMLKVNEDHPYVVERDKAGRGWRIWCRSDSAPEVTVTPTVWKSGPKAGDPVTFRGFDLTAVFADHGFMGIGPRSKYQTKYMHTEWWHFQCEGLLIPFVSQFGIELLSFHKYNDKSLKNGGVWDYRRRIFKSRRNRGWH